MLSRTSTQVHWPALITAGAIAAALPGTAQDAASIDLTQPGNFAVAGDDLYDLSTGELVWEGGVSGAVFHAVAGRPGHYAGGSLETTHGVLGQALIVSPPGVRNTDPQAVRFPAWDWQQTLKIDPALHQDLRRMVWFEAGDIYRATFNWETGEIQDKQQVTNLGAFQYRPHMIWSGNTLLLDVEFDEAKPVVRVDLMSGEVTEHREQHVLEANWESTVMTNPSVSHALRFKDPAVWVMDLQSVTSRPVSMEYEYESVHGNTLVHTGSSADRNSEPIWIDDSRLFFANRITGEAGVLDARAGSVRWLATVADRLICLAVLPGGTWVDAAVPTPPEPGGSFQGNRAERTGRVLVNIETGEREELGVPVDADVTWLTDRYGVYFLQDGGLSSIGCWAVDRELGTTTRLTPSRFSANQMVFNETHGLLLYRYANEGNFAVPITGGDSVELHDKAEPWRLIGPALELGLGSDSDPWQEQPAAPAGRDAQAADEPQRIGIEVVWAMVADEPAAVQDDVMDRYAYFSRNSGSTYYNPVELTRIYFAARKQDPDTHTNNLLNQLDVREAISVHGVKESIEQQIVSRAQSQIRRGRVTYEEVAQEAEWVAQYVADHLPDQHPETGFLRTSSLSNLIVGATTAYRDTLVE